MRKELFLGFTYLANVNYYLNPDLYLPPEVNEFNSYVEIRTNPNKALRRIREYTKKAYENLSKIL